MIRKTLVILLFALSFTVNAKVRPCDFNNMDIQIKNLIERLPPYQICKEGLDLNQKTVGYKLIFNSSEISLGFADQNEILQEFRTVNGNLITIFDLFMSMYTTHNKPINSYVSAQRNLIFQSSSFGIVHHKDSALFFKFDNQLGAYLNSVSYVSNKTPNEYIHIGSSNKELIKLLLFKE